MTSTVKAYGAESGTTPLVPLTIKRRALKDTDVSIKIKYCGMCHSDIHTFKNEWGGDTKYPIVVGHEIIGEVDAVGSAVTKFKVGQIVGVGCMVDSCNSCEGCDSGFENHCRNGMTGTYGSEDKHGTEPITHGGYSQKVVVTEKFVLSIPDGVDLASTAPLLCAGITCYAPLVRNNVGEGKRVGIVGIGGLGHVGVKIARALGAHVVAFTTRESKRDELLKLGAHEVIVGTGSDEMKKLKRSLDLILTTVSATYDISPFLQLLKYGGKVAMVGAPEKPLPVPAFELLFANLSIEGYIIGSVKETQDMLNFCAKHKIGAEIETINIKDVNVAVDRLVKGDVRYRFVIDVENSEF